MIALRMNVKNALREEKGTILTLSIQLYRIMNDVIIYVLLFALVWETAFDLLPHEIFTLPPLFCWQNGGCETRNAFSIQNFR